MKIENSKDWLKSGSEGFSVLKEPALRVEGILSIYSSVVESCILS